MPSGEDHAMEQRRSAVVARTVAAACDDFVLEEQIGLVKLREVGEPSQNELGRLTAMDPATTQGVIRRPHRAPARRALWRSRGSVGAPSSA